MPDEVSASSSESTPPATEVSDELLDSALAGPAAVDAPRAVAAATLIMRWKPSWSNLLQEPAEEGLRKGCLLTVLGATTGDAPVGEPSPERLSRRGKPWRRLEQQRMRWLRGASRWPEQMACARHARMASVGCVGGASCASSRHRSSPSMVAAERAQRSCAADSSCVPIRVGYASLPAAWRTVQPSGAALCKPPSGALRWLGGGSLSSSERLATCRRQKVRMQAREGPE